MTGGCCVFFSNQFPVISSRYSVDGRDRLSVFGGDLTYKIFYSQPNETIDKLRTQTLLLKPEDVQIIKNESK